jgi:hypothetical protein
MINFLLKPNTRAALSLRANNHAFTPYDQLRKICCGNANRGNLAKGSEKI